MPRCESTTTVPQDNVGAGLPIRCLRGGSAEGVTHVYHLGVYEGNIIQWIGGRTPERTHAFPHEFEPVITDCEAVTTFREHIRNNPLPAGNLRATIQAEAAAREVEIEGVRLAGEAERLRQENERAEIAIAAENERREASRRRGVEEAQARMEEREQQQREAIGNENEIAQRTPLHEIRDRRGREAEQATQNAHCLLLEGLQL